MTALEAIRDNLNMLEMTATHDAMAGNDLAIIARIRRDLASLHGYDDVEEFIPAEETDEVEEDTTEEPTTITPSAQDSVKTDEVKSEEGSAQRASKFDAA
jgi:hypothetical protein